MRNHKSSRTISPSLDTGGGLSLRHMPDVSDASFSFQIPTLTRGDYLLAEDGKDFFQGAGVILATPAPPRFTLDSPLTLSQLTPRPSDTNYTKSPSPPHHHVDSEAVQGIRPAQRTPRAKRRRINTAKPKQAGIRRVTQTSPDPNTLPASPAGERIDNLKVQLDLLTHDLRDTQRVPAPISRTSLTTTIHFQRDELQRTEAVPISFQQRESANRVPVPRGIRKTREQRATTLTRDAATADVQPRFSSAGISAIQTPDRGEDDKSDPSGSPETLAVIAERLVGYNEQFMDSNVPVEQISKPMNTNRPTVSPSEGKSVLFMASTSIDENPLTLSQLSPEKPRPEAQSVLVPQSRPMGETVVSKPPLSSSRKRPASALFGTTHTQKKVKPNAPIIIINHTANPSTKPSQEDMPPTRKVNRRRSSGSRSKETSVTHKPKARVRASGPIGATRSIKSRSLRNGQSSSTGNNDTASNQIHDSHNKDPSKIKSASIHSLPRPEPEQVASGSTSIKRNVVRATVPYEFKFHVDARLEARKSESEKPSNPGESSKFKLKHPVPNFRALHAAHEAESAHRKENIHPIIPVPVKFELDMRLKERARFDELVREKELQRHMELEQRRRQREEEEDREIRELRRKAIPKAHEVPEWYRDAPRKVKGSSGT